MKKAALLLGLAALIASGCKASGDEVGSAATDAATTVAGSTTSSGTADTSAATEAPATSAASTLPQAPGQGVTADAIKIGVTYPDLTKIRDIMKLDHGDYASAFQSLADAINAKGGINGRKLELVQGAADVVDPNAVASTCTKFTEDQKVFAVIGSIQADAVPCYVQQHQVALVGGQQTNDLIAAAKSPWFATTASLDHLADKTIEGAASEGAFDGKKVGVISLPVHANLVKDTLDPALQKASVDVVGHAVIDAPANDQAAATAQTNTILEKFRSEDVDVLVVVGDTFSPLVTALGNSDYRPRVIATDASTVAAARVGRTDYSMFKDLITGGQASASVAWADPGMQACVKTIETADPTREINDPRTASATTLETWVSPIQACSTLSLFTAIAEKAGPGLNNDTFKAAGDSLGAFDVPGTGGGQVYSADATSGNPPVYLQRFNEKTTQLDVDPQPVA